MWKLNLLAVFLALQISSGLCFRRAYFPFPVNCQGEEVYPWSEGCEEYIQCNGSLAEIRQCPHSNIPETLSKICVTPSSEVKNVCKFQCAPGTERKQVVFLSPDVGDTPYWGLCVKGTIIQQGKCTPINNYETNFISGGCKIKCPPSITQNVEMDGCKKYIACVKGIGTIESCGENEPLYFINGKCRYMPGKYQCPSSSTTPQETSNPSAITPTELFTTTPSIASTSATPSSSSDATVNTESTATTPDVTPNTVSASETTSDTSGTTPITVPTSVTPTNGLATTPTTIPTRRRPRLPLVP